MVEALSAAGLVALVAAGVAAAVGARRRVERLHDAAPDLRRAGDRTRPPFDRRGEAV